MQFEQRIRDLEEQLRKERENLEGNAKEREMQLKRDIEEWQAKFTAKERELQEARDQIQTLNSDKRDLLSKISQLELEI